MSDLSDDELTVLMIADRGEALMPIGRWEAPVRSLLECGYLHANPTPGDAIGVHNSTITDAGRQALRRQEDEPYRQVIVTSAKIARAQHQLAATGEQAAQVLVGMARASAAVTGNSAQTELRNWSKIVLSRALELLGG
jgi:hypothetical protein